MVRPFKPAASGLVEIEIDCNGDLIVTIEGRAPENIGHIPSEHGRCLCDIELKGDGKLVITYSDKTLTEIDMASLAIVRPSGPVIPEARGFHRFFDKTIQIFHKVLNGLVLLAGEIARGFVLFRSYRKA